MANLAQLRVLEELNGFLLVDKPAGIAFSSVVKAVKRKFNLVKVGHGGALDAAASGLLVLLVNDANRFVGDVMGADRSYEGTMHLGVRTNTHDIQGERLTCVEDDGVIAKALERLDGVLPDFRGDIFQTESRWCSVRREGSAAYEVADTGEHKPFMAHVYKLDVVRGRDFESHRRLEFRVTGTKGLLVRTLVNDLGDALGCGACLDSLRRTGVGGFRVGDAMPFDRLLETSLWDFGKCVLPLGTALR